MDALSQIVIKKEFNKNEFDQKFIRKFKKNTLPFNLFLIYLFTVASILLVRFNKIKLIVAILTMLLLVGILILMDFLYYKIDLKKEIKNIKSFTQTSTLFKDRVELQKEDELQPRVFMYSDATISYNRKKDEIEILFNNGAFIVPRSTVEPGVFEYLMTLVEKEI